MKQELQVVEASGNTTRLTITPDRVTVKFVKDTSEHRRKQLLAFVEYVVEQFVVIDKVWRGVIKTELDGVTLAKVSLKPENSKEPNRKYECAI